MVITCLRNPSPGSEFQITAPPGLLAEAITGTEEREGAQVAALSSRRPLRRLMKSQIVFNQIPSPPDRNHTAIQMVQEQERCILNTLPAVGLSVTN